jgi:hypothetical protein
VSADEPGVATDLVELGAAIDGAALGHVLHERVAVDDRDPRAGPIWTFGSVRPSRLSVTRTRATASPYDHERKEAEDPRVLMGGSQPSSSSAHVQQRR